MIFAFFVSSVDPNCCACGFDARLALFLLGLIGKRATARDALAEVFSQTAVSLLEIVGHVDGETSAVADGDGLKEQLNPFLLTPLQQIKVNINSS